MFGIVTGLWAGSPKNRGSITGMGNRFFFLCHKASVSALGPSRWDRDNYSPGNKATGP